MIVEDFSRLRGHGFVPWRRLTTGRESGHCNRHADFLPRAFSVVISWTHREKESDTLNIKHIAILSLLTAAALLIHGYHPYAEDAEIYLPGRSEERRVGKEC